jgi:hypothetical protein
MASDIGPLLCLLFPLVQDAASRYRGVKGKGHLFEDEVSRCIYDFAIEYGFDSHPPRLTLDYDTYSGNQHQFDASLMKRDSVYLIECKNTQKAAKDYLYYFNAKIMDYVDCERNKDLIFSGIFVSAVPVAESALRYAFAYGIRVVSPDLPPPELIHGCGDAALDSLSQDLISKLGLKSRDPSFSTDRLLDEYRYLCSRWRDYLG